jgi:Tfp pilus assembly protein PilO
MMENLTQQERDIVKAGAILVGLVLALAFWYNIKIVKPELKKLQEAKAKVDKDIAGLNAHLAAMDAAEANLKLLQEQAEILRKVAQKLPQSIDPQGFYTALSQMLQVTRIEYSEMNQEKPQKREVYTEIPYKITCRARYHDFGQFLNLVEENPHRLMRVKTFKIENRDTRPSIHPINVQLATFMFNKR